MLELLKSSETLKIESYMDLQRMKISLKSLKMMN